MNAEQKDILKYGGALGILVFKWCEDQISTAKVLKLASREPLFGHRRGKTIFLVFMKSTTPTDAFLICHANQHL